MPTYRFSGSKLREIRKERGETIEQLAARQNPPWAATKIYRAELGYHVPRIETIAAFAMALGVRVEDLLELVELDEVSA